MYISAFCCYYYSIKYQNKHDDKEKSKLKRIYSISNSKCILICRSDCTIGKWFREIV